MPELVPIPSDPQAITAFMNEHFDGEAQRKLPIRTLQRLVWQYIAGARRFDVINMATGEVQGYNLDKEGRLEYQGGELLRAVDQLAAYITSYDLSPKVTGEGQSLTAVQEGAVGQALADSIFSNDEIQSKAAQFAHIFVALGSCGLNVHVDDVSIESIGLNAEIEVVHPMEIVPFPHLSLDITKQTGIGRESWIPLESLYKVKDKAWVTRNKDEMYFGSFRPQADPANLTPDNGNNSYGTSATTMGTASIGGSHKRMNSTVVDDQIFVRIRELWLYGPRGTCSRKITISGNVLIQNTDYSGVEAYCPLSFARFMENGTFFGAGLFHILYSLSRNLERINKSLFQEVVDRERHGWLVVPQGAYNVNNTTREVGTGLKLLTLEPDPFSETGFKPFLVQPNNVGDSNTRVAMYARQNFDMMNPLVDIVKEKGRIDSERGLSFLQEQIDRAMTSPTRGIISAFGSVYKAGLAQAAIKVLKTDRPIPVGRLSLDLVGAVVDWTNNTVKFSENPIPSLSRIRIRPSMNGPRSKAQRKQEAMELLKMGIGSPTALLLKSFEEGWDLAMWTRGNEAAHQSIVMKILSLYANGEQPGQIVENPHFAKPEQQLLELDAFMGSPKMSFASVEVQNAFIQYRKFLIENTGRMLPEGLPYNPEDIAAALQGGGASVRAIQAGTPGMGGASMGPSPMMRLTQ